MNVVFKPANRRIVLLSAALLFLIILCWGLFTLRRAHVLEAIPSQTALVALLSSPAHVEAPFLGAPSGLTALDLFQTGREDAKLALDFFEKSTGIALSGPGRLLAAGFSLQPPDSLHPVFILDVGKAVNIRPALASLNPAVKVMESVFKGQVLYTVHLSSRERLVIACFKNLLLFSRYSYLVEDALIQLDGRNAWWLRRAQLKGKSIPVIQIILRPGLLAERCQGRMNAAWQQLPVWLSTQLDYLAFTYTATGWSLSGKTFAGLPAASPGASPGSAIYSILPDNVALLAHTRLPRPDLLRHFFRDTGPDQDFRRFIRPWLGKEAAYVLLEPFSPNMAEDQFLLFATTDETLTRKQLQAYGEHSGMIKSYEYQTFEIRQFLSPSLLTPVLPARESGFQNPVSAVLNGYVIFAATPSAMELWIDKYIVSQTLANRPDFLLLQKQPGHAGAARIYLNSNFLPLISAQLFSARIQPKKCCGPR
ncbi:MAG: DUF3352 domain-containing protein [Saprospirales bacterium]|nr:DUF3352 domain-containing protein [Saprospirales bacterium]